MESYSGSYFDNSVRLSFMRGVAFARAVSIRDVRARPPSNLPEPTSGTRVDSLRISRVVPYAHG